jgi:hypothetical protein
MKSGFRISTLVSSFTRCLLLPGFAAVALAQGALAQQNSFVWTGNTIFVQTNNPAPDIDAINLIFKDGSVFEVILPPTSFNTPLYTTSDTLNVTNFGVLAGEPGFDFEYFPSQPPLPQPGVPFSNMAGTFANLANGIDGGFIQVQSETILPPDEIQTGFQTVLALANFKVNATNIINTGTIQMDNAGLIDLRGQHLDLRHGTVTVTPNPVAAQFNIGNWGSGGFGTNSGFWVPGTQLTPTSASSALFTNFQGTHPWQEALGNSTCYMESANGVNIGGNNFLWRYIFLQDFSPSNVTHNVYFEGGAQSGAGEFHIEWVGTNVDPVTGVPTNSYLYLSDDPAARRPTNYNFTLPPIKPINTNGSFTLVSSPVKLDFPALVNNVAYTNPWINLVTNDFAYISLQVSGVTVTNEIIDGTVTNVPGRVQLTSSQDLNLANARINVPNYVLLSSPAFQGNSNSLISTTFADLYLGVTNGSLTISNLLNPKVPIYAGSPFAPSAVSGPAGADAMGGIQAWSGSFTNFVLSNTVVVVSNATLVTNTIFFTNDVRILIVNSAVQPSGPHAFQQNVVLHAPNNLTISDELNIFQTFSSDTQVLTIATNGPVTSAGSRPGAFNPFGQINLLSPDIFWSTSLSNLQYFTNSGVFSSLNQTFFAGGVSDPFSDLDSATPYQAFINHGAITNVGTFIRANAFENSGVIDDDFGGSIDIVATPADALATNGLFLAPFGYVSISANSLLASNGIIEAGGGSLTLNTPCSLSDGYVFGNQFAHFTNAIFPHVVTNGNIWLTSGDLKVPVKPPTADLLGTTIEDFALNNVVTEIVWPAQDLGPVPQGFGDNLGVGRLFLTADSTSTFNFVSANGNNAIYIDTLIFENNTTNTDGNGNHLSIEIQPGMNVYYSEAIENGVSIAEKLNGKFGADATNANAGRFFWVPNYAGVYGSTNILYPDGNTYIFNHALAISSDINSGGPDGTQVTNNNLVNSQNPFPIPTNVLYDISVTGPQPCVNVGGNNQGGNSTNLDSNPTVLAQLTFPPKAQAPGGNSNPPVVFSVAAGSYNGLFYDTTAVKPASAGSFSATVTSKGGFSAKLQLGSHAYSFSSKFNGSGSAVVNNVSAKGAPTLSVSLQLVNNDQITGYVSGKNWGSQLQADRAAFSSKSGTASAGKDTLLLAADEEISTTSSGEGFGTTTIGANGSVQLSATLPDGVKFTEKSALSKAGVWPVYASLYGGTGLLIGWMQCTNQMDITGSAVWEMPGGAGGLYAGGLTNQIKATGSRLQGAIPALHYNAVLSGAGLGASLTNKVMVVGKTVQSGNALKLSVNPQTGLFSGTLTLPNTQRLSFQGALLEKSGVGGGFFLNADQSGKVYFGPAN